MTVRQPGEVFATTDHCGRLEILNSNLDPAYCQAAIVYGFGRTYGFDRVTRPSLERMSKVTFRVPITKDGAFDVDAQRNLAREFTAIQEAIQEVNASFESISELKPKAELPKDVEDISLPEARSEFSRRDRGGSRFSPQPKEQDAPRGGRGKSRGFH